MRVLGFRHVWSARRIYTSVYRVRCGFIDGQHTYDPHSPEQSSHYAEHAATNGPGATADDEMEEKSNHGNMKAELLKCDYPGCTQQPSFTRKSDLKSVSPIAEGPSLGLFPSLLTSLPESIKTAIRDRTLAKYRRVKLPRSATWADSFDTNVKCTRHEMAIDR